MCEEVSACVNADHELRHKQSFLSNNHVQNLRGMIDVYGQLSADYATQEGDQMAPIGRMLRRLLGEG